MGEISNSYVLYDGKLRVRPGGSANDSYYPELRRVGHRKRIRYDRDGNGLPVMFSDLCCQRPWTDAAGASGGGGGTGECAKRGSG